MLEDVKLIARCHLTSSSEAPGMKDWSEAAQRPSINQAGWSIMIYMLGRNGRLVLRALSGKGVSQGRALPPGAAGGLGAAVGADAPGSVMLATAVAALLRAESGAGAAGVPLASDPESARLACR